MKEYVDTEVMLSVDLLPPQILAKIQEELQEEEPYLHGDTIDDLSVTVGFYPGHYEPARFHGSPDNWSPSGGEDPEVCSVRFCGIELFSYVPSNEISRLTRVCREEQLSWEAEGEF